MGNPSLLHSCFQKLHNFHAWLCPKGLEMRLKQWNIYPASAPSPPRPQTPSVTLMFHHMLSTLACAARNHTHSGTLQRTDALLMCWLFLR